ncbi:conserved hypothetical protein [Burkholderia sp. 8Y]|uniref:hypothetical protein n=1 Tax=Burkholderia sp. 8Y TaxID=2653133 RepID=UPI0012F0450F|nr:hypothetical protein [Burkholderia sp. 8Y]VXC83690.1 conserved hypothetical protein [Burkholderia sp. 8Y]
MKLAKVKVEYSCGLTITETASVETVTGAVFLPPRLIALLEAMNGSECPPVFTMDYDGHTLQIRADGSNWEVAVPTGNGSRLKRLVDSIASPTKGQRQQNGQLLHTLSAAAIVSAAATVHSATSFSWNLVGSVALQAGGAVLLWYVGFRCMKGD